MVAGILVNSHTLLACFGLFGTGGGAAFEHALFSSIGGDYRA